MWRKICAGLVLTTCLVGGCSKESDNSNPTPPPAPPLPDSVKPRPTTQQLSDRITLDLKYDPISMKVPPSWELKSMGDGSLIVLEGFTPSDMIGISLPAARPIMGQLNVPAAAEVTALEATARAAAAKHPELFNEDVVRNIPGATIIEQLDLDAPVATTQEASSEPVQTLHWVITVCVPNGKNFTAYDLRFTGLTLKTYKADQQFLRGIVDSIAYVPPQPDSIIK